MSQIVNQWYYPIFGSDRNNNDPYGAWTPNVYKLVSGGQSSCSIPWTIPIEVSNTSVITTPKPVSGVNILNRELSLATGPNSSNLQMIWVDPGTFMMGQSNISNASPVHEVTISRGFYLSKYELNGLQYYDIMDLDVDPLYWWNNGYSSYPFKSISWQASTALCSTLTNKHRQEGLIPQGWYYTLPTEAEWEYACRAGTTTIYPWGDELTASDANFTGSYTAPGSYPPNAWGFYDMIGNVAEWVLDWYDSYSSEAQTDPYVSTEQSLNARVVRGGSLFGSYGPTSAQRWHRDPYLGDTAIGLRVALKQS